MMTRATLWAILLALAGSSGNAWSQPASAASAAPPAPGSATPASTVNTTSVALATVPAGPFALTRKDGKGWAVRVPVVVAEGKAPATFTLVDALFKEGRSIGLIESFQPRFVAAANNRGPALELDTGDKDLLPGSYVLSLMLSESASKSLPQAMTLTVTVGAPQVKVETTKVVVAQIRELFGGTTNGDGTLKVSWGSGPAPMGLTPVEVHDPPAKGEADTAGLKFTLLSEPATISTAPTLAYQVAAFNRFPLGTTIGRIDLHSPSMATPVSVPFVAYVRRSYWWISVIAALGALAGWVLRTQIPRRRSLLLAGAAIASARRSVLQGLQSVADADFKDKMKAISRDLDRADEDQDAALRTAAAKTAEDAVRTVLAAIETQVPPLRSRIEALHDQTDPTRQLPENLTKRMRSLAPQIERAAQLLNDRDIGACTRLVGRLETVDLVGLREDVDAYLTALTTLLNRAGAQPFPMGANLADHLAQIRAAAAHAVPSPDVPTALARVQEIFRAVQRFGDAASIKAEAWCAQVKVRLFEAFGAIPSDFDEVAALCTEAADQFSSELQDPIGSDWPAPADSPLVSAWKQVLTELAPALDAAALELQLEQGRWYEAVAAAVAAAPALTPSEMAAESIPAGAVAAMAEPFDEAMVVAAGQANVTPRSALTALTDAPTIADLVGLRQALLEKEQNFAFIQSVGFALVFVAGVHLLYATDWVGTYKELAALFILAFGVDLTSDSVIAALKK